MPGTRYKSDNELWAAIEYAMPTEGPYVHNILNRDQVRELVPGKSAATNWQIMGRYLIVEDLDANAIIAHKSLRDRTWRFFARLAEQAAAFPEAYKDPREAGDSIEYVINDYQGCLHTTLKERVRRSLELEAQGADTPSANISAKQESKYRTGPAKPQTGNDVTS